tara:strand:+ start:679 stop:1206 length:528 start_codon:yes stop_codon:yes gene_type:complete
MIDDRKILLLNSDYRALRFVNWGRALKLMYRGKVDIVSEWGDTVIRSVDGTISLPSTLRLKNRVHYFRKKIHFSKAMVKRRDNYTCQYCGKTPTKKNTTIDHVIPVSKGGETSYENCVTACYKCNNKKNNKLLSQIDMKLINKPTKPLYDLYYGLYPSKIMHPDWKIFIGQKCFV